jgi:hypothetical protein
LSAIFVAAAAFISCGQGYICCVVLVAGIAPVAALLYDDCTMMIAQ